MIIDLLHNKIVRDTVTENFKKSFNLSLVPKLESKYGDALLVVQMYEDYLKDGFFVGNIFHYPLTLVFVDEIKREWISWKVSSNVKFAGGVPYSYVGDDILDIQLASNVPSEFESKLGGRGIYFEGDTVLLNIESAIPDKTFLSGKYSQGFVDEMRRQLTGAIEDAFSADGLKDSTVELTLVFAPETYMEHVVENTTYRRLLISAKGCGARDFWIKWTHNGSPSPLSVSDSVMGDEVTFELGEDVPQKIREKEYRFLVRTSADKYQSAMGRKNITEWRDVLKRVIKRGELVKRPLVLATDEENKEITYKLQEILTGCPAPKEVPAVPVVEEPVVPVIEEHGNAIDLDALLLSALGKTKEPEFENPEPLFVASEKSEPVYSEEVVEEAEYPLMTLEEPVIDAESKPEVEYTEEAPISIFDTSDFGADFFDDIIDKEIEEKNEEPEEFYEEEPVFVTEQVSAKSEEDIRREIEAEMREKLLMEAEELRRQHEALKLENERLQKLADAAQAERNAEAERLRREIEARKLSEQREKERIAEEARMNLLENQRIAREREEAEKRRIEQEERLRLEIEKREEEARLEAERRAHEEKFRAEIEAEIRRQEAERVRAEERAKAEAEARARAIAEARIRAEIEARAKAEGEARARAEAEARIRAEAEAKIKAEAEARAKAEREARERAEAEARIRAEAEAKIKAEAEARARAEKEARERKAAEERIKREEEARRLAEAEEQRRKEEEAKAKIVNKTARLIFRRHVDPNITKRIHEIIVTTIKYFHKENVYMKIKATVPDATTVVLEFSQLPEEESELIVNIIKVLGKSELGITKVYLE